VVWALPDAGRDYASALLETVEFVSAGPAGGGGRGILARSSLPMLASGMGQFHQLRRRLVMIKHARVPRSLSGPGWLAVGALALGLLPLAPTVAQVATSAAEDVKPATAAPGEVTEKVNPGSSEPASISVAPVDIGVGASATVTNGTVVAPVPTAAPPEISDTPIIEELRSNPKPKNNRGAGDTAASLIRNGETKLDSEREALRAEVRELARQLERAQRRLADLDMAATQDLKKQDFARWKTGLDTTPAASLPEKGYGKYPPGAYVARSNGTGNYGGIRAVPADPRSSREHRLAEVEANLKALLEEVRTLRNEAPAPPTPLTKPPQK
jgi:hypothetical protein